MIFGDDGLPNSINKRKVKDHLVSDINNEAFNFKETLYEDDQFGMIYETCKDAYKVITINKLTSMLIKVLNKQSKYQDIKESIIIPKLCVKMT